jgi:tRNA G26 N,N-dimethylase Trm1
MDELAHYHERELRALMTASLDGNAGAYHALFERLTGHLRAYYRRRFALIGHGHTEAEDLLQEALIAIHTHRGTYDPLQPFTPWVYAIALQVSGLSPAHQVFVQEHADGERARAHGPQRSGSC